MTPEPPPALHTPGGAWPPERPPEGTQGEVVLAYGPFVVCLADGQQRIGFRLAEVYDGSGAHTLQWDDDGRVHQLADDDWVRWGDSLASGVANAGSSVAIRPLHPEDYQHTRYADLGPEAAAAAMVNDRPWVRGA